MEPRYIRLNYGEALSAKKELLSAELNTLMIAKKLKEYNSLKEKEFALKKRLKSAFSLLKTKTNLILSTFPKDENNMFKDKKLKKTKKNKEPEKDLQKELEMIQKKLSELR